MSGSADQPPPADRRALLQSALEAVDRMQAKLDAVERARREPIAIVGMSCRFPGGATSPAAYWELLRNGVDAVVEAPRDRWAADAFARIDPEGGERPLLGGFLDDIDQFDPQFFGIAPREAKTMDPQQRLVLEVCWEALEAGGYAPDRLNGTLGGVFVGLTTSDYAQVVREADPRLLDVYFATGNAHNATAGRVAYLLGLRGPAVAVDTACSSSLTAIHLACQSLRQGDADFALAGGVNVMLVPDPFVCFTRWGMMAPDGRCKTFDERADGFVRSEGCGIVLLKRLSDALTAGDPILAVIRGSAVNQDGASGGLTVPNGLAQQAVVRQALSAAGLTPADIDYVEAHGTGTSLGDPVELEALDAVFGPTREAARPLLVGSAKTNLGHCESASGVAGLMKVVLALQHHAIPPHLHFQRLNPRITLQYGNLAVTANGQAWPAGERPRRAGVSSFGFSGTNGHVIVEEAPLVTRQTDGGSGGGVDRGVHILTVSARSENALRRAAARFADYCESTQASFADVCYTTQVGRSHGRFRLAVAGSDARAVVPALRAAAEGRQTPQHTTGQAPANGRPRVAFLFTGQGAQYTGMGRAVYDTEAAFRLAIDRCDELLRGQLEHRLLDVLYPASGTDSPIDQTAYTQPALFAYEYALAELWRSWGVVPDVLIGHSIGEYVAACLSGVFSLEDALSLVAARGRLMQALPSGGAMAAVFASGARVHVVLEATGGAAPIGVAAYNAPDSTVISGAAQAVEDALAVFQREGVDAQRLVVSHAFHSPLVEPMLADFHRAAQRIAYRPPAIPVVSNVTGVLASGDDLCTPDYWVRHVRAAVRFADGMQTIDAEGVSICLEVGPSATLIGLGRRTVAGPEKVWIASQRPKSDGALSLADAVARLHTAGVTIDWAAYHTGRVRRRVLVPTAWFERTRYWVSESDAVIESRAVPRPPALAPLIERELEIAGGDLRVFETSLEASRPAYLRDHVLYGTAIFPATGYVEMFFEAVDAAGLGPVRLTHFEIEAPLRLSEERVDVQVHLRHDDGVVLRVFSRESDGRWRPHASARCAPAVGAEFDRRLDSTRERCTESVSSAAYYADLAAIGLEYGPAFRGVAELWRSQGEALGRVELPNGLGDERGYLLHPALLDAAFHVLGVAMSGVDEVCVPVGAAGIDVWQRAASRVWCHATIVPLAPGAETTTGEIALFDDHGAAVARVSGLLLKRARRDALASAIGRNVDRWLYQLSWRPVPLPEVVAAATGSMVVVSDGGPLGDAIVEGLRGAGRHVTFARCGAALEQSGPDAWTIPQIDLECLGALVAGPSLAPRSIVGVWEHTSAGDGVEALRPSVGGALALAQWAAQLPAGDGPRRLWCITAGAQRVEAGEPGRADLAGVWGLWRSVALEHPELRPSCIDVDEAPASRAGVVTELQNDADEDQLAWRHGARFVARLAKLDAVPAGPREIVTGGDGVLDHIRIAPLAVLPLGPRDVEVRVHAASLNFRDVLNALGMYPGPPLPLGNECAGIVERIGSEVTSVAPGDEVIALALGALRTHVITEERLILRKPSDLTFVQAASVPTAYLTAAWGLERLAGLSAGQWLLVPSAAGGVGLAAINLAHRVGARVIALAGSHDKREFLRGLGVAWVGDSRSLAFVDEVRRLVGPTGVHVVLNSLTDEFIPSALGLLGYGGAFLEIGKRGIWSPERMRAARPDVRYYVYDQGEELARDPDGVCAMLGELMRDVAGGALPSLPVQAFPLGQAGEAFRLMAQARHIGKVVVSMAGAEGIRDRDVVRGDAGYLVTGGSGPLGLAVARWLVDRGAGAVTLLSRREPDGEARHAVDALRARGVVQVVTGDVTERAAVDRAIAALDRPLAGIVHAAGVLDDGPLEQQSWTRSARVLAPKVEGAIVLREAARGCPLDFFVLFSGGAGLLGSAGQASYAAANAWLDGFALASRSEGWPILSIDWGAWAGSGMAGRVSDAVKRAWAAQGVEMIAPADGVRALERLLQRDVGHAAVLPTAWERAASNESVARRPVLRELVRPDAAPAARRERPLRERLSETAPEDRLEVMAQHVHESVCAVLALDRSADIPPDRGLTELGMDSLMAVELSNRLRQSVDASLPRTLAFEHPTIEAVTAFLVRDVLQLSTEPVASAERATVEHPAAAIDTSTLDEIERALAKELLEVEQQGMVTGLGGRRGEESAG